MHDKMKYDIKMIGMGHGQKQIFNCANQNIHRRDLKKKQKKHKINPYKR